MAFLHTPPPEPTSRDQEVTVLLDADYLSYMVAAISQHKDKPDLDGCEYVCIDETSDTWVWVEPDKLVGWKLDRELNKIRDLFRSEDLNIFLTPSEGNFRDTLAVSRPYKGKRTGARPHYYHRIREMMMERGAMMCEGQEADDQVCIEQMFCMSVGRQSVIVSQDKDLQCMFGWNYVPRTGELKFITPEEAKHHFYTQLITGDTVDNIAGIKGRGKGWAEKVMADEGYDSVVYEEYMRKHDYNYMIEQGNLLHMRRQPGDTWSPNYDWHDGFVDDLPEVILYDTSD